MHVCMYIICMYIIIHIYVLYVCIDIRMTHQIISMGKNRNSEFIIYTPIYRRLYNYYILCTKSDNYTCII